MEGLARNLPNPQRKWVPLLMNPRAGAAERRDIVDQVAARLCAAGLQPEILTEQALFSQRISQAAARETCRAVVLAGGDGTLQWGVNQRLPAPLAILPVGSENLLARHLGIRLEVDELTRMIITGKTRTLDLGNVNGRRFTLMASSGFDAAVTWETHRQRTGHVTRWDYVRAMGRAARHYRWPSLRVWRDEGATPLEVAHLFVFNLPKYALDLPICPQAMGDDGWLDVVAFRRPGLLATLGYAWSVLRGRQQRRADIIQERVRSIRVEADFPVPVQTDGDPCGVLPVHITIEPAALSILVPSATTPNFDPEVSTKPR